MGRREFWVHVCNVLCHDLFAAGPPRVHSGTGTTDVAADDPNLFFRGFRYRIFFSAVRLFSFALSETEQRIGVGHEAIQIIG